MRFIFILVLLSSNFAYAAKLKLICNSFSNNVETELNKPLKAGSVRYVGQTTVGFLDSKTFSLKIETHCDGFGNAKVCKNIVDTNYCSKPKEQFKFRSIKDDQSVVMISNRCNGKWTKYQLISEDNGDIHKRVYFDQRTYFQLKNQIYSGVTIQSDKPVFIIYSSDGDKFDANLVSFNSYLWDIDNDDPMSEKINASLREYEYRNSQKIFLKSTCNVN